MLHSVERGGPTNATLGLKGLGPKSAQNRYKTNPHHADLLKKWQYFRSTSALEHLLTFSWSSSFLKTDDLSLRDSKLCSFTILQLSTVLNTVAKHQGTKGMLDDVEDDV